jgi:hypothetical protein
MTVQTSSPGGCGCDGGGTNHYPLALPNNDFLCTNSHVDSSRILHYLVYLYLFDKTISGKVLGELDGFELRFDTGLELGLFDVAGNLVSMGSV